MSDAKKQHYVPQFYLREFLDPNTPPGQEPYVWVFSKDGKKKQRRAPKNILWSAALLFFAILRKNPNIWLLSRGRVGVQEFPEIKLRDIVLFLRVRHLNPRQMVRRMV